MRKRTKNRVLFRSVLHKDDKKNKKLLTHNFNIFSCKCKFSLCNMDNDVLYYSTFMSGGNVFYRGKDVAE